MSLRGRVLKRTPYSPDAPAASYQSQLAQYKFLARVLHISQYEFQSWITSNGASGWLTDQKKLVPMKQVWPAWPGPATASALVVPVQKAMVLNMFWADTGGVVVPTGQYSGFVYKTATNTWVDGTEQWQSSGTLSSPAAVTLDLSVNMSRPMFTVSYNQQTDYVTGTWLQNGAIVKECYFVHPFLYLTMKANGKATNSVYFAEKSL